VSFTRPIVGCQALAAGCRREHFPRVLPIFLKEIPDASARWGDAENKPDKLERAAHSLKGDLNYLR
jgi:hypothetical protein